MKRWHKILLAMLLGIAVIAPLLYRMLDRPMPQANHGLSIAASLGVTFPVNVLVSIPLYIALVTHFRSLS